MKKQNVLYEKSYAFAIRIVKLSRFLKEQNEYILSKQIVRSGTAIGALISEAKFAQSHADFLHKLTVALKEANETNYWLNLLYDTEYITEQMHGSLYKNLDEILALLIATTKTLKARPKATSVPNS